MQAIIPYLRTLSIYNRPDYTFIYDCFLRLMRRLRVNYNDKYEWETDVQHQIFVSYFFLSNN